MNQTTDWRENNSIAALAALIHAIAQSAGATQGRRNWDGLVEVVNGQNIASDSGDIAGASELAALRQQPDDRDSAEILARALLARADDDQQFRSALNDWRSQNEIQGIESTVSALHHASTAAADDDMPGQPAEGKKSSESSASWSISEALQIPFAVLSVAAAFLALKWPLFRVAAVVALTIAAAVFWNRRRSAQSWRDRPLVFSGVACAVAIIVLAATYLSPHSARSASQAASPGSTVAGTAANSPARVEGVTPLNTEPGVEAALAHKIQLTSGQLARLNGGSVGGGSAGTLRFLSSIHAVPIGSAFTNVTMIGNGKTTVTITGMQVLKHCHASLAGTLFSNPSQGVNGTIGIGFNLDSPIDYAQKSDYGFRGNFFRNHVITLAPGETQTFHIRVATFLHYCQFTFQMTVATPAGTVTETINDNGKAFELTSRPPDPNPSKLSNPYAAEYVGGITAMLNSSLHDPKGSWVKVNPKTFHG